VVLVRDLPPAALLAQPYLKAQAVIGLVLELFLGPATEQRVREGNIATGGDVERDDFESGTVFLPFEAVDMGRPLRPLRAVVAFNLEM
jgi:hypothetical protein